MGKLIEGLWDCKYCGSIGNKGSMRECPNCGRPRDNSTKFYLPNNISYVPEEKAKNINRNPDWLCPYCDSLNSDSDNVCTSCGSSRTSKNSDYFSMRSNEDEDTESSDIFSDFSEEKENTTSNKIMNFTSSIGNFLKNDWNYFLISIAGIALILGLVYLFIPKNEEITITGFFWQRSISIERYQTVEESDWSLPPEARLQETRQEIYTYEQVLDHYETHSKQVAKERLAGYEEYVSGYKDLGNGYFEEITSQRPVYETYYETEYYEEPVYRSEPVYKTKYYYEIDKWLHDRSLTSNGPNQDPYWREVPDLPEDERVSGKTESYYIIGFNKKGKEKKISIPYSDWINLKVDTKVKLKVSAFGDGELIK